MVSIDVSRDEARQLLSLLIDRKIAVEGEIESLQQEYREVGSLILELDNALTGAETYAPAELADITWDVNDDRDRLNRINRAIKEPSEVNQLSDELFQVVNGKGKIWVVKIEGSQGSCTCPDFQKRGRSRGMPCKHMYAAKMYADAKITAEEHADHDMSQDEFEHAADRAECRDEQEYKTVNDGGYRDELGTFALFRAPVAHDNVPLCCDDCEYTKQCSNQYKEERGYRCINFSPKYEHPKGTKFVNVPDEPL